MGAGAVSSPAVLSSETRKTLSGLPAQQTFKTVCGLPCILKQKPPNFTFDNSRWWTVIALMASLWQSLFPHSHPLHPSSPLLMKCGLTGGSEALCPRSGLWGCSAAARANVDTTGHKQATEHKAAPEARPKTCRECEFYPGCQKLNPRKEKRETHLSQ